MQSEIRDNCLYISGEVSVRTLDGAAYQRFDRQCAAEGLAALDFGGVARADSACLSLLLTVLCHHSGSLKIRALPAAVADLAQLYEIETWLDQAE